ncbi:Hypothetical predicted protein [Prunus dulcis]|uniref:Uncharacterized protein n=1 Tax=Prunus dulcis TaxID=3755 RepID=A0A5E4GFZ6_PRUDU|nr:Hypothetical predicted protein [Prunus dulcis]
MDFCTNAMRSIGVVRVYHQGKSFSNVTETLPPVAQKIKNSKSKPDDDASKSPSSSTTKDDELLVLCSNLEQPMRSSAIFSAETTCGDQDRDRGSFDITVKFHQNLNFIPSSTNPQAKTKR